MHEFLIVGGGVIGLSLARELAGRRREVLLVDRQQPGTAASWAATGMLPPPERNTRHDPVELLRSSSHDLHVKWSAELRQETGIDNQLHRCGGVYLARQAGQAASLRAAIRQLRADGIEAQDIDPATLAELEPGLGHIAETVKAAYFLPDEYRLRTPRHLQALARSCEIRGVEIRSGVQVQGFEVKGQRVCGLQTNVGTLRADEYCITTGTWTAHLLATIGWNLPIRPWRGQIVLWKTERPLVSRVIYDGMRYLVPRDDGHLLAGSTVEDVGFAGHVTDEAVAKLKAFSRNLMPQLESRHFVKAWAGLRPGTADGQPYLGRVPGITNLTLAAGHFRSGIHLAPATAVVVAQVLCGEEPQIDLWPFRLDR